MTAGSPTATETFAVPLPTGITASVNIDGVDGDGPHLLMLGGPHSAELMRGFIGPRFTSAGFRLVTVEYRGIPPTDVPEGHYTVAQLTADLIALLEQCRLAPIRVYGYSLGANVVLELLAERPDLVERAVLGGTRTAHPFASAEMHDEYLARTAGSGEPEPPPHTELLLRARLMFGPRRLASDAFTGAIRQVLTLPPTEGHNVPGLTAASRGHEPSPDRLATIRTPCRVIGFEHDVLTPAAGAREIARLLRAEYREIRNCGHGAFIEQPRELTRLVTEFLGGAA
ncbi:alpha/beta fold hydrolase [Qaidamihabitans albus]|uniref:alpha/beta fold hydrolase n=1 Tax=Qaidamihabitans albus TaxID=2795733 RepID=UPI0018F1F09B|nr:alpha/beta fold hydrolase [Qaidamihabitans albus]